MRRPLYNAQTGVTGKRHQAVYDLKGQRVLSRDRKTADVCAVLLNSDGSRVFIRR